MGKRQSVPSILGMGTAPFGSRPRVKDCLESIHEPECGTQQGADHQAQQNGEHEKTQVCSSSHRIGRREQPFSEDIQERVAVSGGAHSWVKWLVLYIGTYMSLQSVVIRKVKPP